MEYTDTVLILRVGAFKESDVWVRFFSASRGLASAFAFGGRRSRRRFCGCLDALNTVVFSMKRERMGRYVSLTEGSLMRAPQRLRRDPERLGMAVNCLKFVEALFEDGGCQARESGEAFALLHETLEVLEGVDEVSAVFPTLFRARAAFGQGLLPELSACRHCGAQALERECRLDVPGGGLVCAACAGGGHALSPEALHTLRLVRDQGPAAWAAPAISGAAKAQVARAVEQFVAYHAGLAWRHNRFAKV